MLQVFDHVDDVFLVLNSIGADIVQECFALSL
jgi:hypothetical protein